MGEDYVVQPGYQSLIEWCVGEVVRAGGKLKTAEKVTAITLDKEGERQRPRVLKVRVNLSSHPQRMVCK